MKQAAFLLGVSFALAAPFAIPGTAGAQGIVIDRPGVAVGVGISDYNRPRFHEYVVRQDPRSFYYDGDVEVGVVLPDTAVTYYEVPDEYELPDYRYTIVNDRTVIVDPRTRRVIQVIDYDR